MVVTRCKAEGCHVYIFMQASPHLCKKHRRSYRRSQCCGDPSHTYQGAA